MKDGFWMLLCAACLLLSARSVQARELTALDIFAQLPITLFENTPEGLSEDEKLRLIEQGASEFWEVERFDADRLVLVSRPFGETRVGLRVFRGGDRLLAALGTDGGAMCALELWQEDATGGFVPANPPDDPQLSDFLASGQRLAADGSPAFMFCLEDDGLDVRPLFWGPAGLVDVPVAKSVRYIWKSGAFEKTVSGKPEELCCGDFRTCQAWIDAIVYGFCGPSRNYGPSFTMSLTPFCPRRPHVCFCCSCDGYGRCRSGWRR